MKRRVAPRSLTALIAAVLVGSAVMPGAAVAETPDSTTPETSETPAPESQQPDTTPAPSPNATVTPTPAPTSEKPSPDDDAPSVQTPAPSPTVEKLETRSDDDATPAEADVMPDGPLKRCITPGLAGKEATLAETEKLTSVSVDPSCALPGGTPDPSNLPAMDDWKGARFLSGVTELTVTGFDAVTVPRKGLGGLAKIEKLSLADNQLTKLPDLGALPELTSLDLSDNRLSQLTVPTAADVPLLAELDVSENQISDVSGGTDAAVDATIIVTDQKLTHPDITARATQQLADVITVPDAWTDPSWKPGEKTMAAVDVDAGTFSAARPGTWSLSWTVREGKVSYSGSTAGDATAPEPETISFTKPGPVAVEESATYRADVSNLPTAVRSELDYQWYRGGSTSKLKPVDGATDQVFTIDSVSPDDDGSFVKLVARADGAAHQSVPALLALQLDFEDEGFEKCLDKRFPGGYDDADLAGLRSLDCSGQGIQGLDDLAMIDPDGNISFDLSDNLVTDLSPLVSSDGLNRNKQVNLSDNRIEDVTPLGDDDVDLSDAPANLIVLDGNQIQDVSDLGRIGAPDDLDPASISVRRQVVDRLGGPVNTEVSVDVSDARNVNGDPLDLTLDGEEFNGIVRAAMRTVKSLTWDEGTDQGVAFSGTILVPIGDAPSLGLAFPTVTHVGGDTVSVVGGGFEPREEITLRATGGEKLFDDEPELEVTADDTGDIRTTFTLSYGTGTFTVVASNQLERLATAEPFEVVEGTAVTVPDEALRECIADEVNEDPRGEKFLRSQLDRITADFSCRNGDVQNLTGLEAIPSPSIDLSSNDVASLTSVKRLNDATTSLDLTNNELDSLGDVNDQPRLRELNLSQNRLTDLTELDDVAFADDAEILAVGQTIALRQRVVGGRTDVPAVTGLREQPAVLDFPDNQGSERGRSFIWSEAGDQRIDFALRQAPRPDEEDNPEDPEEAQAPGLELSGSFLIRVVSAPPAVRPQSDPPAQQTPPAAAVQTLAPRPLAERVQPEDDDDPESPRAVALGPEVALEEASPPPRTVVTNPTVEKRDPITSQAGWGLTATGWSLLGAALLAMALAGGIAVLTLGRSTR